MLELIDAVNGLTMVVAALVAGVAASWLVDEADDVEGWARQVVSGIGLAGFALSIWFLLAGIFRLLP